MSTISVPQVTQCDPPECILKGCSIARSMKVQIQTVDSGSWTSARGKAEGFVHLLPLPANDDAGLESTKQPVVSVCPELDALVGKVFTAMVKKQKYSPREGKVCCLPIHESEGSPFLYGALVGLGSVDAQGFDVDSIHPYENPYSTLSEDSSLLSPLRLSRAARSVAAVVTQYNWTSLSVSFKDLKVQACGITAFLESFFVALTVDDRFKSVSSPVENQLESLEILLSTNFIEGSISSCPSVVQNARDIAEGVQLARELVSSPPNYCNPPTLAKIAANMGEKFGLEVEILNTEAMEKLKMGAFLAVGKGSVYPPYLIHLTYVPPAGKQTVKKKIAFVGKGLTMDTGGYNLKTTMIELMKWDMGGGAAVLGAAQSVGVLKPDGVEVHFIVGAAENSISKDAYRPGDIITVSNGKTIEVGNTDAEGRLVLSDCLVFAEKLGVDVIVDLATLTGSCYVGLGRFIAGVYASQRYPLKLLLDSSRSSGEALWPMPLHTAYRSDLESRLADMNNTPHVRFGGTIHAALFLKEFVKQTPWCHIDMPGPCWDYKESQGTGYGVGTLVNFVLSVARNGRLKASETS